MATRKISDLTLLGVGQVSSSDTLLLLDNSDPTDQNKRSAVGSIFTAVPSGTYTAPGVRFEGKTATGVFSETQGQVGLAMGNARLNLQKVGTTLNIQARDDADTNLDFTISAQGTGKIRLGSILAVNDLNFIVPNSIDETKVAKFSSSNLVAGITNIYSFPPNTDADANFTDELVTLKAAQTIENKTIVSPSFSGSVAMVDFATTGNATIGNEASDSLTVNAGSIFSASATFANTLIAQQSLTLTGDLIANSHIDMVDDKIIKLGTDDDLQIVYSNGTDASTITDTSTNGLTISSADVELASGSNKFFKASTTDTVIYHNNATRVTTTATGININGAIDAVTSITGSGDIAIATNKFTLDSANGNAVFGGNITGGGDITASSGTAFQLGSSSSAKLGVGRAAATYNLEVEGDIYSTGSTIIAGNGSVGKFILQKGAAAIGIHFTNNVGTDEAVIDASGRFGIGKTPAKKLDVSGDAGIDGDITIVTTNPTNNTGGKISARELVLTDPSTGATTTLNAISGGGGLSRGKVFFLSN